MRLSARGYGERVLLACHMLKAILTPCAPHQVPCLVVQLF